MAGPGAPDAPTWRQSACGAGKSLPGSTHRNCRGVRIKGGPEVRRLGVGRPTRSEVPQALADGAGSAACEVSREEGTSERGFPSEGFACGFRRVKARRTITPSGRSGHPGVTASLLLLG